MTPHWSVFRPLNICVGVLAVSTSGDKKDVPFLVFLALQIVAPTVGWSFPLCVPHRLHREAGPQF